jgi:cytidine deaminase
MTESSPRRPERLLMERAREAAASAHAPYSHFHVGAAVLCANGAVVTGCNVESPSYGLSCCAERVALFTAVARGLTPIRLAVCCATSPANAPAHTKMPCGACRQVMLDIMGPDALVEIHGVEAIYSTLDLLPLGFRLPGDA